MLLGAGWFHSGWENWLRCEWTLLHCQDASQPHGFLSHALPAVIPTPPSRSGVLDVAASVVALLRRFFPEHIDALEPEQAFLEVGWVLLSRFMPAVSLK